MGFLDRLLGREDPDSYRNGQGGSSAEQAFGRGRGRGQRTDDEIALERYRYLLKTAPPETIEQVHAEAFARLTPEQRRQVYEDLAAGSDRPTGDDPESLARSATRSEIRQPGTLERAFGGNSGNGNAGNAGYRGGPSFGSMVGSSILGTVAGYVIGSAIVGSFMPDDGYGDGGGDGSDGSGSENYADSGSADAAPADSGGWGDLGGWGDGGGGDFGGGDFGGGDF